MNSIHQPRKRCRVKSVNFRSFHWLLVREAVLSLAVRHDATRPAREWRASLHMEDTHAVAAYGCWLLRVHPQWRILP